MVNERVARQIYEEQGEIGFWYFYKDALKSHLGTIKYNAIDGPLYIYQGIVVFALGILMVIFLILGPIIFSLTKIRSARKASKQYKKWIEENK